MIVLGIETSCDETAVAIVTVDREVLARQVFSQLKDHQKFGGVVPEVAARAHLARLPAMVQDTVASLDIDFADLEAIAATTGPGLIGGLLVGSMLGQGLALAHGKPFYSINHLEGHILSPRLEQDIDFPYLVLLVSGGHTQFVKVNGVEDYQLLGTTIDDAVGEAFDKTAKLLGLEYPGGPEIEKLAQSGNSTAFDFPRSMKGRAGCDFSFSGLKTAVRYALEEESNIKQGFVQQNIAASFQAAVGDIVCDRLQNALEMAGEIHTVVVAGGVAANQYLRGRMEDVCKNLGLAFHAPPLELCTDNADMIAWAAVERLKAGIAPDTDVKARPRWPLNELGKKAA